MGPNWELVSDVINSTLQFKVSFGFISHLFRLWVCPIMHRSLLKPWGALCSIGKRCYFPVI